MASRQRRRARPHLRSASSTSSDSEDRSQPPPQRGTKGKSNESRRSAGYSATSQIELRELIASEVESLRSSGEEGDKTSVRLRHKRNARSRRAENVRCPVSRSVFALLTMDLLYFITARTHLKSKVKFSASHLIRWPQYLERRLGYSLFGA
jgi:hypothetical protein